MSFYIITYKFIFCQIHTRKKFQFHFTTYPKGDDITTKYSRDDMIFHLSRHHLKKED